MSVQFYNVLSVIGDMKYHKNESAKSGKAVNGHEDAISAKLEENGFVKIEKFKTNKTLSKMVMLDDYQKEVQKIFPDMPDGSFICQPCGANNFPDFLIRDYDGSFKLMEAKSVSGDSKTPAWNDNYPKNDCIYIFSTERNNSTTIFLGRDIIDTPQQEIIKRRNAEIQRIVDETNIELLAADTKNRGWALYHRAKYIQKQGSRKKGTIDKLDFFLHTDREQCEKNALDFARGNIEIDINLEELNELQPSLF